MKLPSTVMALDYDRKGELYIRFKHAVKPIGEPMKDGLAIFFYDDALVAVEVMDTDQFL